MKYITRKWLEKNDACVPGLDWYGKRKMTVHELIDALIVEEHYDWANWLLTRVLDKHDNVRYALFAARQCEPQSKDPRVKQCNDTVQAWLDGEVTIQEVESAELAARSARSAAWSAESAARSARSAAWSAESAGSAWSAAESAAWSVGSAARSAESAMWSAESAESAGSAWSAAESAAWKIIIAEGLRIYEEAI